MAEATENPARFFLYGNKNKLNPMLQAVIVLRKTMSIAAFGAAILCLFIGLWPLTLLFGFMSIGFYPTVPAGKWHTKCPACDVSILITVADRKRPTVAANCPICTRRLYLKDRAVKLV